jgi:hypothetical protein
MRGVFLPGNSTVDIHEVPDPEPGPGQVLLAMRAPQPSAAPTFAPSTANTSRATRRRCTKT